MKYLKDFISLSLCCPSNIIIFLSLFLSLSLSFFFSLPLSPCHINLPLCAFVNTFVKIFKLNSFRPISLQQQSPQPNLGWALLATTTSIADVGLGRFESQRSQLLARCSYLQKTCFKRRNQRSDKILQTSLCTLANAVPFLDRQPSNRNN